MGAPDLVIAYNIVPKPKRSFIRGPLLPGRLGQALYEFNPLYRVKDLFDSFMLLISLSGHLHDNIADVFMQTHPSSDWFWDFYKGNEIVETTREDPGFTAGVARIRRKWQELSAPRIARTRG